MTSLEETSTIRAQAIMLVRRAQRLSRRNSFLRMRSQDLREQLAEMRKRQTGG
jgi:hypothetical protein